MSLGMILGGVAKGVQQYEDIQDQRLKRAAMQQKFDADKADFERTQDARAGMNALGIVGQTDVPINVDYDPTKAVSDAIAARHAAAVPQDKPGLIGILASKLKPRAAALGAGVGIGSSNDPLQNPLGLADGTPIAPHAYPAGSPQDKPAPALGAATTDDPNGLTVPGQRRTTKMTYEQSLAQHAAIAKATGTPEQALAAGKAWYDEHTNNNMRAINSASAPELEILASDALGKPIHIDDVKDAKGKPTGGYIATDKDGNVIGKASDIGDLRAQFGTMVSNNPGEAMTALHANRTEQRAGLLAKSTIETEQKRAQAALIEAKAAVTRAASESGLQSVQTRAAEEELNRRQKVTDAIDELAANPDMAITNPARHATLALQAEMNDPLKRLEGVIRETDATTGVTTSKPVNKLKSAGDDYVSAYQSDPYVAKGIVGQAKTKGGDTVFVVKDPASGQPVSAFSSSAEARAFARRRYALPAPTKK